MAPWTADLRRTPAGVFRNQPYATLTCRRPIKMSLLCQIEMTLPGGFAELAYELSVLKRARSDNGKWLRGPGVLCGVCALGWTPGCSGTTAVNSDRLSQVLGCDSPW